MRCSNCGEPIEEGRLFCLNCGQEVQWVPDYDSFGDYMVQEKLKKELERTEAMSVYEKEHSDCQYICGIDEVGRGPLAGPVVAGAVILPKDCDILYINAVCCTERVLSCLYCTGAFGSIGVCYGDGSKWRIFVGFCLVFDCYGNICVL